MKIKIKKIGVGVALGVILSYLLVQFLLSGWTQAINLTTQLFNKPVTDYSVIPHAQDTIQNYIRWSFGPEAKLATAIFKAESNLHCDTISQTNDYGVAQINAKAHPQYTTAQLLDCKTNIQIAAKIYHQQGNFNAWVAYNNGSFRRYLQ